MTWQMLVEIICVEHPSVKHPRDYARGEEGMHSVPIAAWIAVVILTFKCRTMKIKILMTMRFEMSFNSSSKIIAEALVAFFVFERCERPQIVRGAGGTLHRREANDRSQTP
jgi:hypothetical protein